MSNIDNLVIVSSYDDGTAVSIRHRGAVYTFERGVEPKPVGIILSAALSCPHAIYRVGGANVLAITVNNAGLTLVLCEDGHIDVFDAPQQNPV